MIKVERELLKDIYNELVCCRRLRERELSDYIKEYPQHELDYTQIEIFEESIENTRNLYRRLNKIIYGKDK